ncbi:peptidase [Dyadobacter bucti]|uniref:peptidase n=1 Tax=Dyadobacter bucti TaxID=2572203 RepID=UPI001108807B|nr:peptidase [Dyadobacter bucti]
MTYCLGIKVASGLVAIADTRLTSGTEVSTNKKVSVYQSKKHSIFVMTSGLRSVRDKAITYFKEVLEERDASFNKLYKAVNALGEQVRRVAEEDRQSLNAAGLSFNLFAIVGGQLENDTEHKLFLLYPEGNWVEVGDGSPFIIIGNSGYGKPLLYRSLRFDSSMQDALKIGFLSFDSTRVSSNDVDYPIDVIMYEKDSFQIIEHRFEKDDLDYVGKQWSALLSNSVQKLPMEWMDPVFNKIEETS